MKNKHSFINHPILFAVVMPIIAMPLCDIIAAVAVVSSPKAVVSETFSEPDNHVE